MKSESDNWGKGELTHKEKFWEKGLNEAHLRTKRQIVALSSARESLFNFIYYHLVFIGFILTTSRVMPAGGMEYLNGVEVIYPLAPSLIGIAYTAVKYSDSGNYHIGYNPGLFQKIESESSEYTEALRNLMEYYNDLNDSIAKTTTNVSKWRFYNTLLLLFGFGILSALLVFT
ncbi:hypothetical protein RH831_07255 [Halodesulfurarchaeum sp. HSR-GB]|uniref:hypothetical protein n=1 Tax=Halodesulfurarchaeum sp. HSR-GB TaxID=3074077 RepID=UPI002861DCD9|nr:hypothetical protein [Halodesulfurarchaeum sp. HSR-GB]MDR5656978.1 hypothetical protein [Halodesulfurarchaeum sp. HSR-GB]